MNKNFVSFIGLWTAGFLLTACHLIREERGKNEEFSGRRHDGISADQSVNPPSGLVPAFSFRRIPTGSFKMGSLHSGGVYENEKQVPVKITKTFKIMETEVTQKLWFQVMGKNPSHFKRPGDCDNWDSANEMCPDHPVENVSWYDVQEFIKKLNGSMGLSGCNGMPQSARGCYRLPTEAEWEWAVRARTKTTYFFGEEALLEVYAWYSKNSGERTHKTRTKRANPWGLYDVYGNVREWVQDGYKKNLPGGRDPFQGAQDVHILRGGSWYSSARRLRSANRTARTPDEKCHGIGFRLVKSEGYSLTTSSRED